MAQNDTDLGSTSEDRPLNRTAETDTPRTVHDDEGDYLQSSTLRARILETLQAADDVDPQAKPDRLEDAIDTAALEAVLNSGTSVRITFDYGDQTVEIYDDGSIRIDRETLTYESKGGVKT